MTNVGVLKTKKKLKQTKFCFFLNTTFVFLKNLEERQRAEKDEIRKREVK